MKQFYVRYDPDYSEENPYHIYRTVNTVYNLDHRFSQQTMVEFMEAHEKKGNEVILNLEPDAIPPPREGIEKEDRKSPSHGSRLLLLVNGKTPGEDGARWQRLIYIPDDGLRHRSLSDPVYYYRPACNLVRDGYHQISYDLALPLVQIAGPKTVLGEGETFWLKLVL